jgi:hypothetical protein
MADPVTLGALAAAALAMAAEAALKGAVGEAAKDAWKALRDKVAAWAGGDVEALEKAPASAARQAVVAEAIDTRPADDRAAAGALAKELIAALRAAGGGNVGLDMRRLEALEVELGAIDVTQGTGVRIDEARVQGAFKTGPIKVGGPDPGKT